MVVLANTSLAPGHALYIRSVRIHPIPLRDPHTNEPRGALRQDDGKIQATPVLIHEVPWLVIPLSDRYLVRTPAGLPVLGQTSWRTHWDNLHVEISVTIGDSVHLLEAEHDWNRLHAWIARI